MKYSYSILSFCLYDFAGIAQYLEAKAAKGWELDYIGQITWRFHKTEPRKLHYAITYLPQRIDATHARAELEDYCAAAGWELVGFSDELMVFSHDGPDPVPLETSPTEQLENLHRIMRYKYLPGNQFGIIFTLAICLLLLLQHLWTHRPLSVPLWFALGSMGAFCLTMLLDRVIYVTWYKKALAAAQTGILLPSPHILDLEMLLLILAAVLAGFYVLFSDLSVKLQFLLILGLSYLIREFKRSSSPKPDSRT